MGTLASVVAQKEKTFNFQYAYLRCSCSSDPTHIVFLSPCFERDFVTFYFLCTRCNDFQRVRTPMSKIEAFAKGILSHPNNFIRFFH